MFRAEIRKIGIAAVWLAAAARAMPAGPGGPPPGGARGTIDYRGARRVLRYAAAVRGPDAVDEKKRIRRLVLSPADLGPAIARCETMACVDAAVTEGLEVDFDAGPRLNYWIALDGQKTQYSGTTVPAAFVATADDARRLAGRLSIDDTRTGGPAIEAEFDAPFVRAFERAR